MMKHNSNIWELLALTALRMIIRFALDSVSTVASESIIYAQVTWTTFLVVVR